jgi:hypothetical protein
MVGQFTMSDQLFQGKLMLTSYFFNRENTLFANERHGYYTDISIGHVGVLSFFRMTPVSGGF